MRGNTRHHEIRGNVEISAFTSGEVLPELRLHYRTMGVPRRDASGTIVNGVLLLQGNTGTGANWLRPSLADALYGPGVSDHGVNPFKINGLIS
jgi:homoserine acetyltransferase